MRTLRASPNTAGQPVCDISRAGQASADGADGHRGFVWACLEPRASPGLFPGIPPSHRAGGAHEHGHEVDTEDVTDVWEVREATGPGGVELRLRSLRQVSARTWGKGEGHAISAKDPTLWQTLKTEWAADVVKSVPQGIDRVQEYTFRLTVPEYSKLFEGSE
jgi:hypothetical protein